MTPKDRPLNEAEWRNLLGALTLFTKLLASDEGRRVRALLRDMAEAGYPSKASGTLSEPSNEVDEDGLHNQGSSSTERLALNGDRAADFAAGTHRSLRTITDELHMVISTWRGFHHAATSDGTGQRHVPQCGTCGTVYANRDRDCDCVAIPWQCTDCDETDPAKRDGARCGRCKKWRQRHGYARSSMTKYAESFADGVYTESH